LGQLVRNPVVANFQLRRCLLKGNKSPAV